MLQIPGYRDPLLAYQSQSVETFPERIHRYAMITRSIAGGAGAVAGIGAGVGGAVVGGVIGAEVGVVAGAVAAVAGAVAAVAGIGAGVAVAGIGAGVGAEVGVVAGAVAAVAGIGAGVAAVAGGVIGAEVGVGVVVGVGVGAAAAAGVGVARAVAGGAVGAVRAPNEKRKQQAFCRAILSNHFQALSNAQKAEDKENFSVMMAEALERISQITVQQLILCETEPTERNMPPALYSIISEGNRLRDIREHFRGLSEGQKRQLDLLSEEEPRDSVLSSLRRDGRSLAGSILVSRRMNLLFQEFAEAAAAL